METIITTISAHRWIQRWAGSYTFISCAYWGHQYFQSLQPILGVRFDHTLFLHERGVVAFYLDQDEFRDLGEHLSERTRQHPDLGRQWLEIVKENTDSLMGIMGELKGAIPTWEQYRQFLQYFDRHLPYHVYMKEAIDHIVPAVLKPLLPLFEDARRYSEPVYSETERFFRSVMQAIAIKESRNADTLTCLTQPEFEAYLQHGTLVDEAELAARFNGSVLWFDNGQLTILPATDLDAIRAAINQSNTDDTGVIRGTVAQPGSAYGTVRVVLDPYKVGEFNAGDVLVTGMTRPEFLPLMKKAAAIVTDAGGVLSHAAITARELQIPCVIGTELATRMLKDGDRVLVDATAGIIRKQDHE